jgi:hypothetical protein
LAGWKYFRRGLLCFRAGAAHFPVGNMHLKAKFWQNHWRANQAASVPFHSLRFKPWNTDDTGAVRFAGWIRLLAVEKLPPIGPPSPF